jgi:GTP-binding protein
VRIGSRADTADAATLEEFEGLAVSAVTGRGIPQLLGLLRTAVEAARATEPEPEGFVTLRPVAEGIRIARRDDGSFEVLGREATRAVGLSDLTNPEALDVARERLAKLGVDRALAKAGARNGDVVHIAKFSFDYESDDTLEVQPFDERTTPGRHRRNREDDGSDDWLEEPERGDGSSEEELEAAGIAAALAADDDISDEDLLEDLDEDGDGPLTEVVVVRSDRN